MALSLFVQASRRQARVARTEGAFTTAKNDLQALLDELRPVCPHLKQIEYAATPYAFECFRMCLDCGITEKSIYAPYGFDVLVVDQRTKLPTYDEWSDFYAQRPFPHHYEQWTECPGFRGGRGRHACPTKDVVGTTTRCERHLGEICPTCHGNATQHIPKEGLSRLGGNDWEHCQTCGGSGVKPAERVPA